MRASVRGKRARNRGKAWERQVARELREIFENARRGYQPRGAKFEQRADIEEVWELWIEAKNISSGFGGVRAALRQAREETDGRLPIVVYRHARGRGRKALAWVFMEGQVWDEVLELWGREGYHPGEAVCPPVLPEGKYHATGGRVAITAALETVPEDKPNRPHVLVMVDRPDGPPPRVPGDGRVAAVRWEAFKAMLAEFVEVSGG